MGRVARATRSAIARSHWVCCMCNLACMCTLSRDCCIRNTEGMTTCPSAQTTWLARPESDRVAWNSFRTAATRVIARVDADVQQHLQVGYTDVDALIHLSIADDHTLRMASLARAVSRSPSALTRLVDKMEGRRLVERSRHSPTDVSVSVTTEGLDLLAEASPRILALVDHLFWAPLTPGERETLAAICLKLLEVEAPDC